MTINGWIMMKKRIVKALAGAIVATMVLSGCNSAVLSLDSDEDASTEENVEEVSSDESNEVESLPSFDLVYNSIMCLKNNYLRELILEILGNGEDKSKLVCAANLGLHFLDKQKKEEDEFWEKINRSEATVGDLFEFQNYRYNAIYCVLCLEVIKKDDKVFKCGVCETLFHERCIKSKNDCEVCNYK